MPLVAQGVVDWEDKRTGLLCPVDGLGKVEQGTARALDAPRSVARAAPSLLTPGRRRDKVLREEAGAGRHRAHHQGCGTEQTPLGP